MLDTYLRLLQLGADPDELHRVIFVARQVDPAVLRVWINALSNWPTGRDAKVDELKDRFQQLTPLLEAIDGEHQKIKGFIAGFDRSRLPKDLRPRKNEALSRYARRVGKLPHNSLTALHKALMAHLKPTR